MEEQQKKKFDRAKLQLVVLVVAFVLFGLSALFGIASGISYGKAEATYAYASRINQALGFYKNDQGRYPSVDQFYNQRILIPNYLSDLPSPQDVSGACSNYQSFAYAQTDPQTYSLIFCLTQNANGLKSGLHRFNQAGLQ